MSLRLLIRFALGLSLCVFISAAAFAQYGTGGGTGGTGGGTGTYSSSGKSYGSGTGAAIGGGVAAGAVIAYLALHKTSLVGCVEQATDGFKMMNQKDKKTYALDANGQDLKAGEKVQLKGKKSKDTSGSQIFHVKDVKDLGPCSQTP